MNRVLKAVSFVSNAQADLDAALATGADTAEARARLRLAEEELAAAKAAHVEEEASANEEAGGRIRKLVEAELKAATKEVNDSLAELASIEPPKATLPAHTLEQLIRARLAHEAAKAGHSTYQTSMDELNKRLLVLEGERNVIKDRRAAGARNDAEDGPALALLNADIEGLQRLIDRMLISVQI